ncbi:MAG: hypothetical protein OC190_15740 [Novosphingobium aromaticivorans]|jgi:hypothetical protein|nr:hypothetical protein [Novosphingobium aromaticivorans]
MQSGVCLELQYDGFSRLVEVHAVGESKKGNLCMRVYQVDGGSVSGETVDWKLMTIDKAYTVHLTATPSEAPRQGYTKGDRGMSVIYGEL